MAMSIDTKDTKLLPTEVYDVLFSFCSNIAEIRLVCKYFRNLATHRLVPSLNICYSTKEFARARAILDTPKIWLGVKSLTLQAAVFGEFPDFKRYCEEVHRQRTHLHRDHEHLIEDTLREGWKSYSELFDQQKDIIENSLDHDLLLLINEKLQNRELLESVTLQLPHYHRAGKSRYGRIFSATLLIPRLRPINVPEIWHKVSWLNCRQRKGHLLPVASLLRNESEASGPIQCLHINVNTGEEMDGSQEAYKDREKQIAIGDIRKCQLSMDKVFQGINGASLVEIRFGFSFSVDTFQPGKFRQIFQQMHFPRLRVFEVHNFLFDTLSLTDFFHRHQQTIRDVILAYMCCGTGDSWADTLQCIRDLEIPWRSFVIYLGMQEDANRRSMAWCDDDQELDHLRHTEAGLNASMEEFVKGTRRLLVMEELPNGSYF